MESPLPKTIQQAAKDGDLPALEECLLKYDINYKDENEFGRTPLILAGRFANFATVEWLVERNADLFAKDINGDTTLEVTTLYSTNDKQCKIDFLLRKGCHFQNDFFQFIALDNSKNIESCIDKLRKGSEVECDSFGRTPLHYACAIGHLDNVKKILDANPQLLTKVEKKNNTGLLLAALNGHLNVVKYLLDDRKDLLNHANSNGSTAFLLAAWSGELNVVKYLVEEKNVSLRHHNKEGDTALLLAAQNGQKYVVKYLIERKKELSNEHNKDNNEVRVPELNNTLFEYFLKFYAFLKNHDKAKCRAIDLNDLEKIFSFEDLIRKELIEEIFSACLKFECFTLAANLLEKQFYLSTSFNIVDFFKSSQSNKERQNVLSVLLLGLIIVIEERKLPFYSSLTNCFYVLSKNSEDLFLLQVKNVDYLSIKELLPLLEVFTNMRLLDLSHNQLSSREFGLLLDDFRHSQLTHLVLRDNNIKCCDELEWKKVFERHPQRAREKNRLPCLERVDLTYNRLHNHNDSLGSNGGQCERLIYQNAIKMLLDLTGFSLESFVISKWKRFVVKGEAYRLTLKVKHKEYKFDLNYLHYEYLESIKKQWGQFVDISELFNFLKKGVQRAYLLPKNQLSAKMIFKVLDDLEKKRVLEILFDSHDDAPLSSLILCHPIYFSESRDKCESLLYSQSLSSENGYIYLLALKEKEHAALVLECITPLGQRVFEMAHLTTEVRGKLFRRKTEIVIRYNDRNADYLLRKYNIVQFSANYHQCKSLWEEIDEEVRNGLVGANYSTLPSQFCDGNIDDKEKVIMENCTKWAVEKIQKHLGINIQEFVSIGYVPSLTVSNLLKLEKFRPCTPHSVVSSLMPEISVDCLYQSSAFISRETVVSSRIGFQRSSLDQQLGMFSPRASNNKDNNNSNNERPSFIGGAAISAKTSKLKSLQILLKAASVRINDQSVKILFSHDQYKDAAHIVVKLQKIGIASLTDNNQPREIAWNKESECFYFSLSSEEYAQIYPDKESFSSLQKRGATENIPIESNSSYKTKNTEKYPYTFFASKTKVAVLATVSMAVISGLYMMTNTL